jgi:hypothetical protein
MKEAKRKPYSSDLTDAQWKFIEPLLPPPAETGRPRADKREIINGILGPYLRKRIRLRLPVMGLLQLRGQLACFNVAGRCLPAYPSLRRRSLSKTPIACWPGSKLIMDRYHPGQEMLRTDPLDGAREGGEEGVAGPTPLPSLARPILDEALALLEADRSQAKDTDSLETLLTYLSDRRA